MATPRPIGTRSGGRKGRARAPAPDATRCHAYRHLRHPFRPQTILSDDEVAHIHATALRVTQELGIRVLLPEARGILAAAGARVRDDMVFIGADIITAALASAPASVHLRGADPIRDQRFEDGAMLFNSGAGCPNVRDALRGRRPGDLGAYHETLKLQQSFDAIHLISPAVEPQDVPIHTRHYAMTSGQLALTDKPFFIYARGRAQVTQCIEMIQLGLNRSDAEMAASAHAFTVINTNSPRIIDVPMAQGLIDMARLNQLSIVTPFCLAGAMAPITVAGALTLQHAESLCAITLAQLTRPGAPVSYGGFSSNVDMKSGAPAFGTPEHVKLQIGTGQLARHIGLPWRSASGAASNAPDMQAAQETTNALWGACMANATLTIHVAGWLEGGLTFDYAKFINDMEAVQTIAELAAPTSGSAAEIGFDAIADVAPGGHFFATAHTMERYQTAFYTPLVAELANHGTWEAAGAQTSAERATQIWQDRLASYTPPVGGAEAAARVADYVATHTARGGAAPLD